MNKEYIEVCLPDITQINELTLVDLLRGASLEVFKDNIKKRSKGYKVRFKYLNLNWRKRIAVITLAVNPPQGHTYQEVSISMEDFWSMYLTNIESENKISMQSLLSLVLKNGDIKIYCTCPSWIYGGYKYMATKMGYAYKYYEHRFPSKKNPRLKGSMCKHAYASLLAVTQMVAKMAPLAERYTKGVSIKNLKKLLK